MAVSARSAQDQAVGAQRADRAGMLLGGLGLASSLFVVLRLLETWKVTPHMSSHQISVLGQKLSYPAANFGALVVLALAALGLAVMVLGVTAAAKELLASRRFVRSLSADTLQPRPGEAFVIPDERPRAFCAGLLRPRVFVSSATIEMLDPAALQAVLRHEAHHARRRDPLRLAVGRVLSRALFFVPGLRELVRYQQALAELNADETAISGSSVQRSALARAMLTFIESAEADESVGIDPARLDYLLGEPPGWRFPVLICAGALAVIVVLLAVALLAGQVAIGSATLAPPFLSRQPCLAVLAAIPAAIGALALRSTTQRRH